MISMEQRASILSQQMQMAVARGGRVQSSDPWSAVMVYGRPVSHLLHLLVTLVTLGLWVVVWFFVWLLGGERREIIRVDDAGKVSVSKVAR